MDNIELVSYGSVCLLVVTDVIMVLLFGSLGRALDKLVNQGTYMLKSHSEAMATMVNSSKSTNDIIQRHLDEVKRVIAATIPYMKDGQLTPENIIKAFEEMKVDHELNLQDAKEQLENLISGVNF